MTPTRKLPPPDLSATHYLCERCGGHGQQPDGCYSMETKKYDSPAGVCQLCGGGGYLGPKGVFRKLTALVVLALAWQGCGKFAHAQPDPARGPLAPHDAVSGFLAELDGEVGVQDGPVILADTRELQGDAITDGGEPVTDAAPEALTYEGEPVTFAGYEAEPVFDSAPAEIVPPTIEVPALTPVGEPIVATLHFAKPDGSRDKITWEPFAFGTFDLGGNRLGIWAKAGKYTIGARVVLVTADEIYDWNPRATFVVGDPPPPRPLAELVSKEQAASLALWYRATIAVVPQIDTAAAFWTVHGAKIAALELAGSEYEAAVKATFAPAFDGEAVDGVKLVAALESVVRELGAPKPTPPDPPGPPVVEGKRLVVILRETEDNTPAIGILTTALRLGEPAAYLKSKGHTLDILDDDNPAALPAKLKALGTTLPTLFILDPTTGAVLHQQPLPQTAAEVLAAIKANGG